MLVFIIAVMVGGVASCGGGFHFGWWLAKFCWLG